MNSRGASSTVDGSHHAEGLIAMIDLNHRELAILRAVEAGRGELLASCAPGLAVDGGWCDLVAVTHLVASGLIQPSHPAALGQLVLACLTDAGHEALHHLVDAA